MYAPPQPQQYIEGSYVAFESANYFDNGQRIGRPDLAPRGISHRAFKPPAVNLPWLFFLVARCPNTIKSPEVSLPWLITLLARLCPVMLLVALRTHLPLVVRLKPKFFSLQYKSPPVTFPKHLSTVTAAAVLTTSQIFVPTCPKSVGTAAIQNIL